jgi:hypothetical protein
MAAVTKRVANKNAEIVINEIPVILRDINFSYQKLLDYQYSATTYPDIGTKSHQGMLFYPFPEN